MSEIKIIELTFFVIVLLILVIFLHAEIEFSFDKLKLRLKLGREESFSYRKLRKKIEEERQERLAQDMRLEQLIENNYVATAWKLYKLDLKTTLLSKRNIERISWDEAVKLANRYKKVELGNGKVIEIMPITEDTDVSDEENSELVKENLELVKEDISEYGTVEYYKIPKL